MVFDLPGLQAATAAALSAEVQGGLVHVSARGGHHADLRPPLEGSRQGLLRQVLGFYGVSVDQIHHSHEPRVLGLKERLEVEPLRLLGHEARSVHGVHTFST